MTHVSQLSLITYVPILNLPCRDLIQKILQLFDTFYTDTLSFSQTRSPSVSWYQAKLFSIFGPKSTRWPKSPRFTGTSHLS